MHNMVRKADFDASTVITGGSAMRGLRENVIRQLGFDIIAGRYPAGSIILLDKEIMKRFKVSRTVVREASNALSAKGLIETKPRLGTRILPRERWNLFDPDVLGWYFMAGKDAGLTRSLAEIRLGMELEAAALAAERRTEEQAQMLLELADRMGQAGSDDEFARVDLDFHRLVAKASGNPFMASISSLVEVALSAAFRMSSPTDDPAAMSKTVDAHRDIARAIEQKAPQKARDAMRSVIAEGLTRAEGRMSAEAQKNSG